MQTVEAVMALLEDKYMQCEMRNMLCSSAFLDVNTAALAQQKFRETKHLLYGGYEDAERRIMVFLPEYYDDIPQDEDPLSVLHITVPRGSKKLTHRDYLGSILALGVDRSVVGDIIVNDSGADIIVLKSMEEFFLANYEKAARANLSVSIIPASELVLKSPEITEKKDTVASLRLDNIVSSAFNLSRTKAQDAVKEGIVFVNGFQCTKPDHVMEQGDKLVLRGHGKVILKDIGKVTKKDRIFITLSVYK